MDDLGRPIAYLVLHDGTPVFDAGGHRVGVVEHVVADEPMDIFEGLVVRTHPLPGRHLFADADQIAELRERGVVLAVGRADLHEPTEHTAARRGEFEHPSEDPFQARLRRAWEWISQRL
jgi:hypothetical protein